MDYDTVLSYWGPFRKWQSFVFTIGCLASLANGFVTLSQSFLLYEDKFRY